MSNTRRPFAGEGRAILFAADILGGRNPLSGELNSRMAELTGVVVPIPTWAFAMLNVIKQKRVKRIHFIS